MCHLQEAADALGVDPAATLYGEQAHGASRAVLPACSIATSCQCVRQAAAALCFFAASGTIAAREAEDLCDFLIDGGTATDAYVDYGMKTKPYHMTVGDVPRQHSAPPCEGAFTFK